MKKYHTKRNYLEQLMQLTEITADGDLISKSDRDELVKKELATRSSGFNVITIEGIALLDKLNAIHS